MVRTGLIPLKRLADIPSFSKLCLFGKWFYVPVNSYDHVEMVS